jgi:hypothetical protein
MWMGSLMGGKRREERREKREEGNAFSLLSSLFSFLQKLDV